MEFDNNKPIYIQIADTICDKILSGELAAEERIMSVREYGAAIGVNPNTVSRSYERLTESGVIYNKRGIGFFVSENAKELVLNEARERFLKEELPQIRKRAELLGLDLKEILK